MLTVDDYGRIRRAHRDGMSIREITRTFHHSWRTIRQVLRGSGEPTKYRSRRSQPAPKLGPFRDIILQILREDETAPPKQRHGMTRIFERLRDEHGYEGSYSTVRRFVIKHRREQQQTFIPLDHELGKRMEADFGEIAIDFPGRSSESQRADSGLVVFERSVCDCIPDSTDRSDFGGDDTSFRVFWVCGQRSLVG